MTTSVTPGWDAIEKLLEQVYPGIEPQHWGTVMRWSDGGPDPLDGVSAYNNPDHWHYISFGLSELGTKSSPNPDESGWGFEFSFRLLKKRGEKEAPLWPVVFMQKLSRYVFNTGCVFDDEHYIEMGGPITADDDTALDALVFMMDPILNQIDTPNGSLKFITPVGLLQQEYAACESDGSEKVVARVKEGNKLGLTDLARKKVLYT